MKTRIDKALLVALALPVVSGCEKSPRDKLQGEWDGQAIEGCASCSTADVQKAAGWVRGTAFVFNGNKVKVVIPAESPRSGTFKVAKVEGDKITLAFTGDESSPQQHYEADLRFVGERELRWKLDGGREIVMTRKN